MVGLHLVRYARENRGGIETLPRDRVTVLITTSHARCALRDRVLGTRRSALLAAAVLMRLPMMA